MLLAFAVTLTLPTFGYEVKKEQVVYCQVMPSAPVLVTYGGLPLRVMPRTASRTAFMTTNTTAKKPFTETNFCRIRYLSC